MKRKVLAGIVCLLLLTGCGYFDVETRTLIDYRHNEAHMETDSSVFTDKSEIRTTYHPENWELQYEITYADGHKDRV